MKVLVVKRIVELSGGRLEGILLLSEDDGGEMWTFDGRQVLEAASLANYHTVPLELYHLEKLHTLGLIDYKAMQRLVCVAVR